MKSSNLIWNIFDKQPLRKSERINGRWDDAVSIFNENLSVGKDGFSKFICFSFSDYKNATSAASAIRVLSGCDQKMPYGYPYFWHVKCSVCFHDGVYEVWAYKTIRHDKNTNMRRHIKNSISELNAGDTVVNRLGKVYVLDGVWKEIRWGWSEQNTFCICDECVSIVNKR